MISTFFFILITLVVIGCGAYYFLINDRGPVPFADIISCIVGFFGSVFCAVNLAAGNIGDKTAVVLEDTALTLGDHSELEAFNTSSYTDVVSVITVDPIISWVFVAAAIMFVCCAGYSIVNMARLAKYERSM